MSYSICGLIIPQPEECFCSEHKWPFVTLAGGVSLLPLERDYLFLTDGDDTQPTEDLEFSVPQWLSDIACQFSKSAYIEAEFWGGSGMQASVVLERGSVVLGPEISEQAINSALRQMRVDDGPSVTLFGLPVTSGRDPFDMIGLGRHRSVRGWLQESANQGTEENRR